MADRVDSLLETCLDRPAGEWEDRITALSTEHPELAAELRRRFERLMAAGLLDPTVDDAEAPPDRLGHYRLVRRVGGGGMGVVYEARDEKLNRTVALKIIRREQLYFGRARQRFEREMQAASRLDHPSLCPIFDAGEVGGVPYIAMRFVDGPSLATRLDERRAAGTGGREMRLDAIALVEKLARALHAAHEAGLVHRDVKPGNVLIDRDGEPVLVDFGLARETDPSPADLTRTGERLGTPAYMAPEQVSGRGPIDRRTDVYALGATLYECLTLRRPFDAAAGEDLYHRILTEPPSDPRAHDRTIGAELCVVVAKALEKDPDDRFATAAELADELRRIRAHEPIRSRRPHAFLRARRWCQRNRAAAGVLAATSVGLCVSLWLLGESMRSARENRAYALLGAAGEVEARDPESAFRYAREALRLHPDARVVARTQEVMFQLRESTVLSGRPAGWGRFSPDGSFVLATGIGEPARLYRRDDERWREVELEDRGWRATNQSPPPVRFAPDDGELALCGGRTVHRYDLTGETPRPLGALPPRPGRPVWSVCYHPDRRDRRLLVVHARSTSVWSRDGEGSEPAIELRVPEDNPELWCAAAFLPNGRIVAAGRVWSADYEPLATLPASGAPAINHVLVAPGHFLTVTSANHVRPFDLDGRPLRAAREFSFRHDADWIKAELDATGTRLLVAWGGRITVLDAASLEELAHWDTAAPAPAALPEDWRACWAPDGRRIAAYAGNGRIAVWDLEGALLDEFAAYGASASLAWSPHGDRLLAANRGGARLWTFRARPGVPAYTALGSPDLAVSPSGDAVVFTSDRRGALYLCDARGEPLARQPADLGEGLVRFVREGLVAVGSERRRDIFLWDVGGAQGDGRLDRLAAPFALGGSAPAMLADRWLLLSERLPWFWWPDRDGVETRAASGRAHLCAAVSLDGRRVAFGGFSEHAGVWLWASDAHAEGERWRAQERVSAQSVALSRDAGEVLAAGGDGVAYLWDVEARGPAIEFAGHEAPLVCAEFSLDEASIATAAADGSICVWNRASRATTLRLRHSGVRRVAFTTSGQLVSAGRDGTVRWWWLDPEPLAAAVNALDIPPLD